MAIRINRVYTRSGDDGRTALVGGRRVAKDDQRIAAYGDVDELNCVVGMVRAELAQPDCAKDQAAQALDETLAFIQQELFDLGSELATPPESAYEGMIRVGNEQIARLEDYIDALQPDLEPLESFVLPGGGRVGAGLHLARTVCRRAERLVTRLVHDGDAEPGPARYLNRLSDLFFVQSRWIAAKTGHGETLWQHGLEPPAARRRSDGTPKKRAQTAKASPSRKRAAKPRTTTKSPGRGKR